MGPAIRIGNDPRIPEKDANQGQLLPCVPRVEPTRFLQPAISPLGEGGNHFFEPGPSRARVSEESGAHSFLIAQGRRNGNEEGNPRLLRMI